MKQLYFIILIVFFPTIIFGQKINDSLLTVFYNKTLVYRFPDSTINEENKKYGFIIIQTDFNLNGLIKHSGQNCFKFIKSNTSIQTVLISPLKENRYRPVYNINHQLYGKSDTIDVNIDQKIISYADKKHISFFTMCGGTMGYIPDCRFIYNSTNNSWILITGKEIANKKFAKWNEK